MGAEIHLYVDFSNVEREQWEAVYDETLQLIDNYPFLDKIVDRDSYAESFIYADRTRDRYLTPWFPHLRGWYTIGDLKSFECGETFFLIRDIGYYKKEGIPSGKGEIYFNFLDRFGADIPELYPLGSSSQLIFDAKPHGGDYHTYIVAIAALIEDRLKPHAVVGGDTERVQLEIGVSWANKHLETPISLPDRCSYTRLLSRIKRQTKREMTQLKAFFFLLLHPHNKELGDFIRENFSRETIREYWAEKYKSLPPHVFRMNEIIIGYLKMDLPLEDLCTILISEDYEIGMTPRECIRAVLEKGWIDNKQLKNWVRPNNQEDLEQETISIRFGQNYLTMAEIRDSTSHYLEETELKEIVYPFLQEEKSADEHFRNCKMIAEQKAGHDTPFDFLRNIKYSAETGEPIFPKEYDIEENAEVIYWKKGDSLRPDVEKNIRKMLDLSDSMIEGLKREYGERSEDFRILALIKHNQNFLVRKETWDYIRLHILDDAIYFRFLSLLSIQPEEPQTHSLLKNICNNLDFLTHHVLYRPISV